MFRRFFSFDFVLFFAVVFLLLLSIGVMYSVFGQSGDAVTIFYRHSAFAVLGIVLMSVMGLMRYENVQGYSLWLYVLSIVLLTYVLFFGSEVNGTTGWIDLGFTTVQPVEIAKLCVIIFLAHFIAQKRSTLGEVATIFGSFVIMAVVVGLTLRQPDMGSALVIIAIWIGMLVASGINKKYILLFIVMSFTCVALSWQVLQPFQKARITTFLSPESDPRGAGYNVIQSMIAVGNGGVSGQGIGYGTQSQLNFLPEKHTDFVFASFVEALGFLGALLVIGLYFVIFTRLRSVAHYAYDAFGYFVVVGVSILLFVHVFVNIGMNIGILPVTGIPLPFMSSGGSAILSMAAAVGIVMSVYRRRKLVLSESIQESY